MARIVPKLNLNKTPELVDNHSLIFAKNVRFNSNGLSADYGFDRVDQWKRKAGNQTIILNALEEGEEIVGVIPYNTSFYLFVYKPEQELENDEISLAKSRILKYDELEQRWSVCACNWNWSGGKIDGVVNLNLNGDVILTIGEYFDDATDKLVPIKSINLSDSTISDDETIYTQAPKIPLLNLVCHEYYDNVIPAGVYQFFVRFEIRKDFYTNWIPVSKELFAGTIKSSLTNQGQVKYLDKSIDSNYSFRLSIDWISETNKENYDRFQLGFILSHDGATYAKAYKHYKVGIPIIDFDYDTEFAEDILVSELLEPITNYYNVGNITNFKNKLYISNYVESEFNPDITIPENEELNNFIEGCSVGYATKLFVSDNSYYNIPCTLDNSNEFILALGADENYKTVSKIVEELLTPNLTGIVNAANAINADITGTTYSNIDAIHRVTMFVNRVATRFDKVRPNYSGPYNKFEDVTNYGLGTLNTVTDVIAAIKNTVSKINAHSGKFVRNNGTPEKGLTFVFDTYVDLQGLNPFVLGYESDATLARIQTKIWFEIDLITLANTKNNVYNVNTLIPHQTYDFYVHFIKDTGEQTNGYKIGTLSIPDVPRGALDVPYIIYPTFTFSKNLPSNYNSCFISIVHTNDNVAQIFDLHTIVVGSDNNYSRIIGDCLELDANLMTNLTNIPAKIYGEDAFVDYKASYDPDNLMTFGSSGKIVVRPDFSGTFDSNSSSRYGFIKTPFNRNEDYTLLTRCTGYLKIPTLSGAGGTYTTGDGILDDMNLLGYLCSVCKPNDNIRNYVSGTDIYEKTYDYADGTLTWHLKPVEENIDGENKILRWSESYYGNNGPVVEYGTYQESHNVIIYSNFNLNFLSLRNTMTPRMVTKSIGDDNGVSIVVKSETNISNTDLTDNEDNDRVTFVLLLTDSSILSEIYELISTFITYSKTQYIPYTRYNILTKFDNTIRSSVLEGDEAKVNTYKFRSTDYYNVPTDKGIIVNLVGVGDNILVHTQDSMYKFSGSNSLMAAGGEEIQTKESEPFDTGIQELFGSEYGYAGLKNKDHQILSEFGYTFWDVDSLRLYLYGGNSQMKVLSDDIYKLLKRKPIEAIYLADDYYNNRIFISVVFNEEEYQDGQPVKKYVTLSYDFNVRSFISLHDFKFNWSFKTKTKCYFIHNNNSVYKVGNTIGNYDQLEFIDTLYPYHTHTRNEEQSLNCVVDVIFNDSFEVIKTLNTLSWICNKIIGFNSQYNMAEEDYEIGTNPEERYKGDYLRLYTDSCMTDLISMVNRSNDARLRHPIEPFNIRPNVNSYQQVRYNLGKWTFNYFRNILHRSNNQIGTRPFRQDDTLLYGKYIVARFVFDRNTNFKFEDVTFNISNEYNV